MIQLTRSNPVSNMHRFYSMGLAPTLFGEFALVMEWGRIGFPGKVREKIFENERAAVIALDQRAAIKMRRGYLRVSGWHRHEQ